MNEVQVDEAYLGQVDQVVLERAAATALRHEKTPEPVDVTIVVTGDGAIMSLNRRFLEVDEPTDVLSFPSDEVDPDTGRRYLGDLIISYPRALAQAQSGGHPVEAELQLLVVHGILHLLGYDHAEETEKSRMWVAQADILKEIGSQIQSPPE